MAKNKSTEKSEFEQFCENLVNSKPPLPKVGKRLDKQYFLIVSQGTETEVLYFKTWAQKLPAKMISIETKGHSKDTIAVVQKAIELREKRKKNKQMQQYNQVWALFDKDDFTDHDYNAAIALARTENIESGQSNECFELWYLLHFADLDAAIGRKVYFERLGKLIGEKYEKANLKVCMFVHNNGDVKKAIARCKKLEELHADKSHAARKPYTRIYYLVQQLLDYLPQS